MPFPQLTQGNEKISRTELMIQASETQGGVFLAHPLITSTFCHTNGFSTTSSYRMTEGHIRQFHKIRIQLASDEEQFMSPTIVLNYHPLKNIFINLVTPQ
jgi:hypothetical protein